MPRRSSRSRPASRTSASEPTGSASRAIAISWHSNEMVGRRAGLGVIVGAAVAAVSIVYANDSSSAASACAAAPVHWEWNARAKGVPWIAAGPAKSRLEGVLFSYRYLGDGRVNRSEGVVLRAGRAEKIAWYSKRWGGSSLTVTGKRLDGSGSFRQAFGASLGAGWYPSGITVPAAGCWQLTLEDGRLDAPSRRQGGRPGAGGHVRRDARRRRRLLKVVPGPLGQCGRVALEDGRGRRAALHRRPHTRRRNTKVLWRARPLGGTLVVSGSRLDGAGDVPAGVQRSGGPQPATGRRPSSCPRRAAGS